MELIEDPTTSRLADVPQLKYFCTRFIAISLFQANIRWRRLPDVVRSLKGWLAEIELPPIMRKQIHSGIGETICEVQRWGEKHVVLFEEEKPKLISDSRILRVQRCEHLRMFYGCITWKPNNPLSADDALLVQPELGLRIRKALFCAAALSRRVPAGAGRGPFQMIMSTSCRYEIDDLATAEKIISRECADWPQMQFQFACAYAMLDCLTNESLFDRIRRRAFAKKLSGHCLYDFWLTILSDSIAWEKMFSSDALAPKQKLSLVFQFAIANGYFELMNFIWERVSEPQREDFLIHPNCLLDFPGLLQWRRICFKAKHREVMRFLCNRLCVINPNALARITWNSFYDALHRCLRDFQDADESGSEMHDDNVRKLEFLLENCCPRLRSAMLSMENFKAITDAFAYNQSETFALLLEYLDAEQLRSAREFVDRIYDRKRSEQVRGFRQMVMRRQNTID
ncbi:unnamed protein product [Toxocara canis]|uniref:Uncharacterized protein n=1 Tax=Toxocara canis TaxID=6265 RepID=A0A183TVA3_TOXCA|nr:unnamed protein product [Toxocara canis]